MMSLMLRPHQLNQALQRPSPTSSDDARETWVAHAAARLDAAITSDEELAHVGLCVVRFGLRWPALVAVSQTHLYLAFPDVMVGTRHALRLSALADVGDAWCRRRVHEHLIVRGRTRTWKFLEVTPKGHAELIAGYCLRQRSLAPANG